MHLLSVLAELLKEGTPVHFCFRKKFVKSLILIDEEFFRNLTIKNDVLAVLAVLY
jgi:hypothetical protein